MQLHCRMKTPRRLFSQPVMHYVKVKAGHYSWLVTAAGNSFNQHTSSTVPFLSGWEGIHLVSFDLQGFWPWVCYRVYLKSFAAFATVQCPFQIEEKEKFWCRLDIDWL